MGLKTPIVPLFQAAQAGRDDERVGEQPADDRHRRQRVIPVDAARPWMGRRRQEQQAGRPLWMPYGKGCSNCAAEGMADDDGPFDRKRRQEFGDGIRLAGGKGIFGAATLGIAMAGAVDKDHFRSTFQGRSKSLHLILQIAAGAMDEDQRREIGAHRFRDVERVDAVTADVGKRADIGVIALDGLGLSGGIDKGDRQKNNEEKKCDQHRYCKPWMRPTQYCRAFYPIRRRKLTGLSIRCGCRLIFPLAYPSAAVRGGWPDRWRESAARLRESAGPCRSR